MNQIFFLKLSGYFLSNKMAKTHSIRFVKRLTCNSCSMNFYTSREWCCFCSNNHWDVVPSISFQTFFVQAFKIVVDSWKFTMLLLYILWDDWPIFMISASNQQLQQQLEYTLLKPDYHSWWISKIQSGLKDTLEERYAIKLYFKLGKNATETYGMLQTAFGASCMNRASVFERHKRFKEGTESVRDDERCGRSKEINRPELIGQRVRLRVRVTMLRF